MPNQEQETAFTSVEQAMGNPPTWLIYWGITVLVFFLTICLGISSLVSYPDVLQATAVIYQQRPPVDVLAPQSGVLSHVWAKDKELVSIGMPLAVVQSTANWKDVLLLDTLLTQHKPLQPFTHLQLGNLNTDFNNVIQAQKEFYQLQKTDISYQKTQFLKKEITQIQALNESLNRQKILFEGELKNIFNEFERAQKLFLSKTISQQDLEKSENTFLQNKRQLETIQSAVLSNLIRVEQLQSQILDLEKNKSDAIFNQENNLNQQLEKLKMMVNSWIEQYVITAPISGKLSIPLGLENGTTVSAAAILMSIIPVSNTDSKSIAKATMPSYGIGKLAVGQKAMVYFDNYPTVEYGMLGAEVVDISLLPQEGNYVITLQLPNNWTTNYGITIPKQENISANVQIQTQDYTILSRLFTGLVAVLE